jgi:hypothetical protein
MHILANAIRDLIDCITYSLHHRCAECGHVLERDDGVVSGGDMFTTYYLCPPCASPEPPQEPNPLVPAGR